MQEYQKEMIALHQRSICTFLPVCISRSEWRQEMLLPIFWKPSEDSLRFVPFSMTRGETRFFYPGRAGDVKAFVKAGWHRVNKRQPAGQSSCPAKNATNSCRDGTVEALLVSLRRASASLIPEMLWNTEGGTAPKRASRTSHIA